MFRDSWVLGDLFFLALGLGILLEGFEVVQPSLVKLRKIQ